MSTFRRRNIKQIIRSVDKEWGKRKEVAYRFSGGKVFHEKKRT